MKKSTTILMLLMMSSHLVAQAVVINNRAGVGTTTSVSVMTISSFQVPANNNRLLVACAVNTVNQNAPSVTYDGTTMTQIMTDVEGGLRTTLYYLVLGSNASATTANIVASGLNITNLGAISFHNVNQGTPYDGQTTNPLFATGMATVPTTSSVNVASSSNDMVCDCIGINANGLTGIAANAGQTQEVQTTKTNSPVVYMGMSSQSGASPNVNMTWNFSTGTTLGTGQFVQHGINIRSSTTLPVALTYFKGQAIKNGNQLLWQTASEHNNKGFYIQRSKDGVKWQDLAFESGKGTTLMANNYEWVDNDLMLGYNYYRLKQVDNDGSFKFSPVILIIGGKNDKILVYPNPTSGDLFYESDDLKSVERIQLYDTMGKLLQETTNINGKFSIAHLPSGLYWLLIKTNNRNFYERIVKQ